MFHFGFSLQRQGWQLQGAPALITFLLRQLLLFYSFQMLDRGYKPQPSSTGHVFRPSSTASSVFRGGRLHRTTHTTDADGKRPLRSRTFPLQVLAVSSAYKGLAVSAETSQKHLITLSLKIWKMAISLELN